MNLLLTNDKEKKMVQTLIGNKTIILKDEERQECEVWTRVMGYYRPVSEFNIGKKSEHAERNFYTEQNTVTHY
jgi:hypothetical protein